MPFLECCGVRAYPTIGVTRHEWTNTMSMYIASYPSVHLALYGMWMLGQKLIRGWTSTHWHIVRHKGGSQSKTLLGIWTWHAHFDAQRHIWTNDSRGKEPPWTNRPKDRVSAREHAFSAASLLLCPASIMHYTECPVHISLFLFSLLTLGW